MKLLGNHLCYSQVDSKSNKDYRIVTERLKFFAKFQDKALLFLKGVYRYESSYSSLYWVNL